MIVGMLVVSVIAGILATVAGAALDLPTWAFLAIYPTTGAVSLLLTAALWSIRDDRQTPEQSLVVLQTGPNAQAN